jgi:hypothetical protein
MILKNGFRKAVAGIVPQWALQSRLAPPVRIVLLVRVRVPVEPEMSFKLSHREAAALLITQLRLPKICRQSIVRLPRALSASYQVNTPFLSDMQPSNFSHVYAKNRHRCASYSFTGRLPPEAGDFERRTGLARILPGAK